MIFFISVATGFPAGQTPVKTRIEEITTAVNDGATEIDVVINRQYALSGNWRGTLCLYIHLLLGPSGRGGLFKFVHVSLSFR